MCVSLLFAITPETNVRSQFFRPFDQVSLRSHLNALAAQGVCCSNVKDRFNPMEDDRFSGNARIARALPETEMHDDV